MPITSQDYDRATVIKLAGELSGDDIITLKRAIDELAEQRNLGQYVIDFSECPFVDSAGLEALLWVRRRADQMFGRVKLIGLDENVQKILEMTRLQHKFEIHQDLAAAFRTLR